MAISYFAFSILPRAETQRRIDYLRAEKPDWFGGMLHVTDAEPLGRFDAEIMEPFGIAPECKFAMHVLNKDWLAEIREALDYAYRVFGTKNLMITFELDSIHAPRHVYPEMKLG